MLVELDSTSKKSFDLKFSTSGAIGRFSASSTLTSLDLRGQPHTITLLPSGTYAGIKVNSKEDRVEVQWATDEFGVLKATEGKKRGKDEEWDVSEDEEDGNFVSGKGKSPKKKKGKKEKDTPTKKKKGTPKEKGKK
ncbi:hypothetical protein TrRE_jg5315 [Triparma retinervis]|uniref:Uncharacterized protein n=1 Tax=Triparma retinervis TaxID=2557542 RepID=A0A9W7DZB2_9STRA|nr:hypothetical protein TrRE_jg5315 [Triparma retinervis]